MIQGSCVRVCACGGGGSGGVAAVSSAVHCWQQISSEVICYSDRAASIFSPRKRTNNEAGKTEGDNKGTSTKKRGNGEEGEEREIGGVKSEGKTKPPGCCWLGALLFRAQTISTTLHRHYNIHTPEHKDIDSTLMTFSVKWVDYYCWYSKK